MRTVRVGQALGCLAVSMMVIAPSAAGSEDVLDPNVVQLEEGSPAEYQPGDPGADTVDTMAVDYYNCTLYPSVIHKRKSGSYNTVGAKPYTICTQGTPTRITHKSTLYKARWLGLNWESMVTKSNSGTNTRKLTLKTVEWRCRNSNNSNFIQRTSGTSVQAGRTFYANVSTTKTRLSCGN